MPSRRLTELPLRALQIFEAAARTGSFKDAAAELFVTPSAISHQVAMLEARLGSTLFIRLPRGLRLTAAGERLGAAARESFAGLERSLTALVDDGLAAGCASLTVSAAPTFAAKWLAPRLHGFQASHPHIELRLQVTNNLIDLAQDPQVDVTLRYGPAPQDPAVRAVEVWPPGPIVAVCAPSLVGDGLRTPNDVLAYSLLRTVRPAAALDASEAAGWSAWLAAAGLPPPRAQGPLFDNTQLTLDAVAAGRGLALAPLFLVQRDIDRGVLARPFDICLPDPFSYWLVCRRDRAGEARIRAFVRWLLTEIAAERGGIAQAELIPRPCDLVCHGRGSEC